MARPGAGFLSRRSRLSTILLVLLSLFLLGTVAVLSTAKAYFSIDRSAYILPEELGTWEEIRWGTDANSPISSWASKYPWVYKLLHPSSSTGQSTIENQTLSPEDSARLADAVAAGGLPPFRDNTPRPADPNSPPEKIPRIIHQTWKDEVLPPKWQAIREECQAMHPDYEFKLWTDASSRAFIAEHYPWFLSVFDGYPYNIQRADAIRYFVLAYWGGVYFDLDIGCRRRIDPLLRFEVILPETRPVGVSNDLIFAAKGHPFMDQMIHNLVTFNHQYLSHYPTVMFSTGPMFVSANYGLYVDAHEAAYPSSPAAPDTGFTGIRILGKSLYGKNAPLVEVPNAFFQHYYGSSWHAGDAGFLIFLRDHGRFLMFLGGCVVAYGVFKAYLPRLAFTARKKTSSSGDSSSRSFRRSGRRPVRQNSGSLGGSSNRWVGLPVDASPRRRPPISRIQSHTPDVTIAMEEMMANRNTADEEDRSTLPLRSGSDPASLSPSAAAMARNGPVAVAAPRPQRAPLPFFELHDADDLEDDLEDGSMDDQDRRPQGFLAWAAAGLGSRPSSSASGSNIEAGSSSSDAANGWKKAQGVLLLPAYALGRLGSPSSGGAGLLGGDPHSSTSSHSPSGSSSSSQGSPMGDDSASNTVMGWASQLLPRGWQGRRGRANTGGRTEEALEMESKLLADAERGSSFDYSSSASSRPHHDSSIEAATYENAASIRRGSSPFLISSEGQRTPLAGLGSQSTSNSKSSAWLSSPPQDSSASLKEESSTSTPRAGLVDLPTSNESNESESGSRFLAPVMRSQTSSRTPPPPYDYRGQGDEPKAP